ncbi:MAG: helix-turn-helix transcriptional regulator [Clostridia bacterium]|nr:helix-turn-helix transcriptional regulator [Clostridia bacterium]
MSQQFVRELIDIAQEPDWKKVNEFLLACGQVHDPQSFVAAILEYAVELAPFDQAAVFFFDANQNIYKQHMQNFPSSMVNTYLEHYAYQPDSGTWTARQEHREKPGVVDLSLIDWTSEAGTFVNDYIRPLGIRYSVTTVFYDLYGNYRTALSMDRLTKKPFTERELRNLYYAIPHLNNLHKNFYYELASAQKHLGRFSSENSNLTKREAEIANLLCQGVSPANISKSLYISPATTYKHIANIYEKLGISSQRELLALMLNR